MMISPVLNWWRSVEKWNENEDFQTFSFSLWTRHHHFLVIIISFFFIIPLSLHSSLLTPPHQMKSFFHPLFISLSHLFSQVIHDVKSRIQNQKSCIFFVYAISIYLIPSKNTPVTLHYSLSLYPFPLIPLYLTRTCLLPTQSEWNITLTMNLAEQEVAKYSILWSSSSSFPCHDFRPELFWPQAMFISFK